MATTIISIGFWIYTLILTGTLIWGINATKEAYQKSKKLRKNGILTQATIVKIHHPKKKDKRKETNILDDELTTEPKRKDELVITYEYNPKNPPAFFEGTTNVVLNSHNVETEKALYKIGDKIDIFYLKETPTISDTAYRVRLGYGEQMFIYMNIGALITSVFVLFALQFMGISEEMNTTENGLSVVFGFLVYLFLFMGAVLILLGAIKFTKDYFQSFKRKRKGVKEKGEILRIWRAPGSKGSVSYHIKYTYPAISPFYLQTIINTRLYLKIQKEQAIEVLYLEKDKFSSDIVGNKNIFITFWLFSILGLLMIPLIAYMFHEFVLFIFL